METMVTQRVTQLDFCCDLNLVKRNATPPRRDTVTHCLAHTSEAPYITIGRHVPRPYLYLYLYLYIYLCLFSLARRDLCVNAVVPSLFLRGNPTLVLPFRENRATFCGVTKASAAGSRARGKGANDGDGTAREDHRHRRRGGRLGHLLQ